MTPPCDIRCPQTLPLLSCARCVQETRSLVIRIFQYLADGDLYRCSLVCQVVSLLVCLEPCFCWCDGADCPCTPSRLRGATAVAVTHTRSIAAGVQGWLKPAFDPVIWDYEEGALVDDHIPLGSPGRLLI